MSHRPLLRHPLIAALAVVTAGAVASGLVVRGAPASPQPEPTTPPSPVAAAEPAVTPSGSPTPAAAPAVDPHTDLRVRLAALLARPDLTPAGGAVGIAVRDAEGRAVLDHLADVPLLPASTQKVVTAAAALRTFGPEHRFVTSALATGPIGADGTLHGDLVLVAGGDPVLGTPGYERYVYPVRPRTPLEELATRVRSLGVRRVAGAVVADRGRFGGATDAVGWKPRYFWDFDARHITGLTVDAGLEVHLTIPGLEAEDGDGGDDAAPAAVPRAAQRTAPASGPGAPGVSELPLDEELTPELRLLIAPDPAVNAGRQLARLLAERGVTAGAEARATPTAPAGRLLAAVESPELRHLLRHTVRRSDNQLADTLFREVGVAVARDGSWEGGTAGVRGALAGLGLDWTGVVMADGSGLSREDRLTAAFLADLDAAMGASEHADEWWSLMAVAGREGTLRRRLTGTIGEGRFLGKTGTLDDVRAVVGTVFGPAGDRFHLAVVGSGLAGGDRDVVRRLMDELTLALLEDMYRCVRTSTAATGDPPADASYTLSCAVPLEDVPDGRERAAAADRRIGP